MRPAEFPIAIDIGSRGVKVAQVVTRAGRVAEVRVGYSELPQDFSWEPAGGKNEILQRALQQALAQAGVKGRRAVCVLPRHQVTLRFTEFPAGRPEDIARMAALEAEQHIPLPAEEIVVGYETLGSPGATSGLAPTLVVAARKSVIQSYAALLAAVNLQAEQITTDAICLFRLWQQQDQEIAPAFVIDIGAQDMVINLVEDGMLRMSRAVPGGGDDLTRAIQTDFALDPEAAEAKKRDCGFSLLAEKSDGATARWLESAAAEIRRSTVAFGAHGNQPTRLYLCGGGALTAGLAKALEDAVKLRTNQLLPAHLTPNQGVLFALPFAAGQAAAKKTAGMLNLVLPEVAAAGKEVRRKRTVLTAAIAAGVALLTMGTGAYFTLGQRESLIEKSTSNWRNSIRQLEQATNLATTKEKLAGQVSFLSGAYAGKHYFLEVLLEIHQRAPKGVWLRSLILEKAPPDSKKRTDTLQIGGKAPNNKVVADLVAALGQIPGIGKVELQNAKASKFEETPVVEFNLTCEIVPTAKPPATTDEEPTDKEVTKL